MSGLIFPALALLVAWAAIIAWRSRRSESPPTPKPPDDSDIDRATLEEAEREVRDMDGDRRGRPTDDVVGDDWGPGTPKTPLE